MSSSPPEPSTSSNKNEPIPKSVNQKRFTLNSSLLCLSAPHKPTVQKVDMKEIADLCSLDIKSLEKDERYENTDATKEFKVNCEMQEMNKSLSEIDDIPGFLDDGSL